jgi:dTDP-4-amino-4,6-dideoxygalactose transaminase
VGRLAICSFYATKLMTTGHGGLLAGDETELRDRAMSLFTHDKRDEWEPRLHFLMSDLNASLGLSQLAKLRYFIKERRRIARRYLAALTGSDRLSPGIYSRFIVAAADDAPREKVEAGFRKAGIDAKRPVHSPLYRYLSLKDRDFPNAAWAHERILSVPLYPGMPEEAVQRIERFLERSRDVIGRWPST